MEAKLVMFQESGERRDFPLHAPVITIGRKDDCDIRIPLAEVSRHHAQVTLTDTAVILKDLGSANGSYVNNKRVKEQKLAPGDHLVVGPVVFTVQINGQPKDIRSVKTKLRSLSSVGGKDVDSGDSSADQVYNRGEDVDPISALEALASSADQTAINPFEGEEDIV